MKFLLLKSSWSKFHGSLTNSNPLLIRVTLYSLASGAYKIRGKTYIKKTYIELNENLKCMFQLIHFYDVAFVVLGGLVVVFDGVVVIYNI